MQPLVDKRVFSLTTESVYHAPLSPWSSRGACLKVHALMQQIMSHRTQGKLVMRIASPPKTPAGQAGPGL